MRYLKPLTLSLLLLTGCGVNTGDPDGTKPKTEFAFNYPVVDELNPKKVLTEDFANELQVIDLINAASPGSEIHIAIYLFDRRSVANPLIEAARDRGVKVSIVTEGGWSTVTKPQKKLMAELKKMKGADGKKLFNIVACQKGCMGRLINHNKFFLFSRVGDDEKVIVQSAANLVNASGRMYENSVLIRGDEKLYSAYLQYFKDLSQNTKNLDYFRSFEGDGYPEPGSFKLHLFPQKTGDKILDIMGDIDCSRGGTSIKIMVSNWDGKRGLDKKLKQLAIQGCSAEVIVPDYPRKTFCNVRSTLYPEVKVFTKNEQPHSKYLILDGVYQGKRQKIVWTGSHNYHLVALRAIDETLLEMRGKEPLEAFSENFNRIRALSVQDDFSNPAAAKNKCTAAYKAAQK